MRRLRAAFFARLEPHREGRALRMLRSAHMLLCAGNVDWRYLRRDRGSPPRRPGAGDDPNHGVCLAEDDSGLGERGTDAKAWVTGREV